MLHTIANTCIYVCLSDISNEVNILCYAINYFLLVTKYNFCLIFTFLQFTVRLKKLNCFQLLWLHNFGGKCRCARKIPPSGNQALFSKRSQRCMSRLVRLCLAQPGCGSELFPPVYYHPNKCCIKFISSFT